MRSILSWFLRRADSDHHLDRTTSLAPHAASATRCVRARGSSLKKTSASSWPIVAAKVIVVGTVAAVLYVAHAAFIPVFLALLLSLILSGPVEALHKRGLPRGFSAAAIVLIGLSVARAPGRPFGRPRKTGT